MHFSWSKVRDILVIVIGIGLVLLLRSISQEQDAARARGLGSRVETCRISMALGIQPDPQSACSNPEIQRIMKTLPQASVRGANKQEHGDILELLEELISEG